MFVQVEKTKLEAVKKNVSKWTAKSFVQKKSAISKIAKVFNIFVKIGFKTYKRGHEKKCKIFVFF